MTAKKRAKQYDVRSALLDKAACDLYDRAAWTRILRRLVREAARRAWTQALLDYSTRKGLTGNEWADRIAKALVPRG